MKKLLSILFLLIFLYNLAGYFIVFKIMQYSAREEMEVYIKNNLADNNLEKVVVPNTDIINGSSGFRFRDDNNEFVYKGKLYDIVRTKSDGDSTVFYCINDKNEEQLFSRLDEHIQKNTDQNLPAKNKAANLIKNIVKEALPDNSELLCNVYSINTSYPTGKSNLQEQYIPIFTPPPKG